MGAQCTRFWRIVRGAMSRTTSGLFPLLALAAFACASSSGKQKVDGAAPAGTGGGGSGGTGGTAAGGTGGGVPAVDAAAGGAPSADAAPRVDGPSPVDARGSD